MYEAENSIGQSAVFKIHVNTKIIISTVIHFTMALNMMEYKPCLRKKERAHF